jgi:GNAT superfamily N-acetyltransferase
MKMEFAMNGFRLLESVDFNNDTETKDNDFNQYVTPIVGAWYEGDKVLGQLHAYRIDAGKMLKEGGHDLLRNVMEQDEELISLYFLMTDKATEGYDFWYPSADAKPHLQGFEDPDWQITYIKLLRVDNDFRGRKLGHRIMSEYEKSLPEAATVLLHSCPLEGPAKTENILGLNRYYESMGFTELEKDSDLMVKPAQKLKHELESGLGLTA